MCYDRDVIIINLPIKAFSVNKAWRGRRYKTKEYINWSEAVILKIKKNKKIEGNVKVDIEWGHKNAKRADIDNPVKLILDALTQAEVIEDDRKIWKLNVVKKKTQVDYIKIKIEKIDL